MCGSGPAADGGGPSEEGRICGGCGRFDRGGARVEYLYVDLADQTYALTGAANGLASHLVRLGINYRF